MKFIQPQKGLPNQQAFLGERQNKLENQKEVKNLIDQTHLGIFEYKTGTSNKQEFE